MVLTSNGKAVQDGWARLGEDDPLPRSGDVIVPLARLERDGARLTRRDGRLGVALPNSAEPRDLGDHLDLLDLIVLDFPAFTDGRAYSQACVLRIELGYERELRASGDVLADQAPFMARVGFDSFKVSDNRALENWRRAARAITHAYQANYCPAGLKRRAADGAAPRT
jgi:uncharacterized protein (DUF934 family)